LFDFDETFQLSLTFLGVIPGGAEPGLTRKFQAARKGLFCRYISEEERRFKTLTPGDIAKGLFSPSSIMLQQSEFIL